MIDAHGATIDAHGATVGAPGAMADASGATDDDTAQFVKLDLPAAPTVLLVDDDEMVRLRLAEIVVAAGYPARTAGDGDEALQSMQDTVPTIVVTDVNMPGMDGFELCRRIRAHEWPGYIYLMLLTVQQEERHILAGLAAGADDYLSKRTSPAQFCARLQIATRVLSLEYSLKSALEAQRRLAMTDALTGVYNRRYFTRHVARELKRAQRFGGSLSLLLIDIDHFKAVNDRYGHGVGDVVLRRLTELIGTSTQRATDWCARLGGEEFAVVLEGSGAFEARHCAEKIRLAVATAPMQTPAGAVRITVSIGVSGLADAGNRGHATVQTLLESADRQLYASKLRGRNCVTTPSRGEAASGLPHAAGSLSACPPAGAGAPAGEEAAPGREPPRPPTPFNTRTLNTR
jgi:diguanylate cyclase (GGDEF)-like protein